MMIQLYDYMTDDVVEIDTADIIGAYELIEGHTLLRNTDDLYFEVSTEMLETLGLTF